MADCRTCGQENPGIARFCLACGTPMASYAPADEETRKTVTVVFVDVVGSTELGERLDAESLREVMSRYFHAMSAAVERHGGRVEKFIGDAVMAVFGIPVLHEDDALRAVRAAADMRGALGPLNEELERAHDVRIQVRVGVATGEVVASRVVGEQRFATGDVTNVAARLEQAAGPGEILIGDSTLHLVRHAVTVEPVGPLALKGKGQPVTASRLVAVGEVGRRRGAPIVGRQDELALLGHALDRVVVENSCRLVTVVGAPGVGKSRLVEELLRSRSGGATVLHGRCLSYGVGITFWPIRGVVAEAAGLTGDESAESARAKIRSLVAAAPDADLIVERVAEAIGVGESLPAQRGTAWAIGRLFEELARRQPLVVVFDDIHWGEPTFLDLVESIATQSRPAPILLLCLARPDLLELRPGWGGGAQNAARLALAPLDEGSVGQLVDNLLGATNLSPQLRHRIASVTEGNPLFVEEVVATLIEEGRLDAWSELSLPPTVQALLGARLDRLAREDRVVLERGAVEGKAFHPDAVVALSPDEERAHVDERLRRLVEREFLLPGPASLLGERTFVFRHQLLRDVAYESVPKALRSELHEQFAGWLEAKAADHAQDFDEILGHHLQRAYAYRQDLGPVDERGRVLAARASDHLGTAGLAAYARGDAAGAANLLARAMTLSPSGGASRGELRRRLDDARFELGEYRTPTLSPATLRCYWSWPPGHTWEMKESRGRPVLRCAACGKATRGPRGWVDKRDDPSHLLSRVEARGHAGGGGEAGGGAGGGD
jgi:class 3 adenylate cyclase